MKKMMMVCGLVIGLPLTALAEDTIEKELNGLNIDVQVVGASSGGPGPSASDGPQILKVTNNSSSMVSCELQPEPSETMMEDLAAVSIEPGKDTIFELKGSYSSASPKVKLVCTPEA